MMKKGAYEEIESDGDDENANVDVAIEKPITVAVRNEFRRNTDEFRLFSLLDKIQSSAVEISKLIKSKFLNNLRTFCESKK